MGADRLTSLSKFLSLVLRHDPGKIGITLDREGWVTVEELLARTQKMGLTRDLLNRVVAENSKKRFAFSEDGLRIRASQGHSVEVDLSLPPATPPEILYHGTAERFLQSILEQGLIRGSRRHVHLSADRGTALTVGKRHGRPVVLVIPSGEMERAGHQFYLSANGVWLTESVPAKWIAVES